MAEPESKGVDVSTVLISGASSGIGKELAVVYAEKGYSIGLLARREDKLSQLAETLQRDYGCEVHWAKCDVTNMDSTKLAIESLQSQLGAFDIVIANAGVGKTITAKRFNTEDAENIFQTNVFGMQNLVSCVLGSMIDRGQGHIVGISSLAAYTSLPGSFVYSSSKAAVNSWLEGLRREVKPRGVTVTTICPGFIKTPMTDTNDFPMPFMMSVEKAARKIAKAIDAKKKVYNFPWQTHGLIKIAQALPDQFLSGLKKQSKPVSSTSNP